MPTKHQHAPRTGHDTSHDQRDGVRQRLDWRKKVSRDEPWEPWETSQVFICDGDFCLSLMAVQCRC